MDQPKNTACQAVAGQCDALAKQLRSDLEARAEALAQEYSRQIASRLDGLKKERTSWQKKLESISFYRFADKNHAREELERLERCIADYSGPAALQQAKMEFARKIDKAVSQYRSQLDGYLSKRFPYEALRAQAQSHFDSWYLGSQSQVKDLIYKALQERPGMTWEEISQAHPVIQERSERRIRFLLRQMEEDGQIAAKSEGDALRYRVAGPREPKKPQYPEVDFAYEDPAVAAQPIPQPPKVEEIL